MAAYPSIQSSTFFKYVHKGHDRATFAVDVGGNFDAPDPATSRVRATTATDPVAGRRADVINEIGDYVDGHWVSHLEAAYRLLGLQLRWIYPNVFLLPVYLENQQFVSFDDTETRAIERIIEDGPPETMLTAFFRLADGDPDARRQLYQNIPTRYVFVE